MTGAEFWRERIQKDLMSVVLMAYVGEVSREHFLKVCEEMWDENEVEVLVEEIGLAVRGSRQRTLSQSSRGEKYQE